MTSWLLRFSVTSERFEFDAEQKGPAVSTASLLERGGFELPVLFVSSGAREG